MSRLPKIFGSSGDMIRVGVMILLVGANLGLAHQLVYGPRLVWQILENQIAKNQAELEESQAARRRLQNRVFLLEPTRVSYDMLEEQARAVLGFKRPNERRIAVEDLLPKAVE